MALSGVMVNKFNLKTIATLISLIFTGFSTCVRLSSTYIYKYQKSL